MAASLLDGLLNNAVLTFQTGSGTTTIDPETGNPIESQETLEVSAKLDQVKDPRVERPSGVNISAIYMEGFAINPAILPSNVTPTATAQATINSLSGRFFLVPVMQKAAVVAQEFLDLTGTRIAGWFEVTR